LKERVVVRAPATVANLGPGFDALGCALAWYDEVRAEPAEALEITAAGRGADGVKRDASNGIVEAMSELIGETPKIRLHRMTAVAFGRGFGSSAISIAAGLVAARALYETSHTDDELLAIATKLEGHADNVAPCLRGGITVTAGAHTIRLDPPKDLRVLACVAPSAFATKAARGVLPETVTRAAAVGNAARAAMLAAALATGDSDALLDATDDEFHQPPRFELMPDTATLVRALRERGIAAFLSGAGPSVAAFVPSMRAEAAETLARSFASEAWEIRIESFDAIGAHVVESR